ncbi:MAG TPA: glycosyltransferase family 2 protein [Stellaceae bacterium]|nr:glycosyltransferase family 2 protein [Stellaceae bacterium]
MPSAQTVILIVYFSIVGVLSLYGWHLTYVIYLYYRHRAKAPRAGGALQSLPSVTVQLPIYNEMYVVERLLEAVARLNYPSALLEIQVLDDSTDETVEIAQNSVRRLAARGIDIKYLHRTDRTGFKAGALHAGLAAARGEFIAIFDADFVPTPDFLQRLLPQFADPKVGMVQSRWGHLNGQYSLLTKIQALMLDAHFIFEHGGRSRSGCFFHFNGTAGIWRREAIVSAGGWHFDTLTEDLDLSYRAQLEGWRFVYLPEVVSPAEVPIEINGFKAQQRRWTKGTAQTCFKILPRVLRARLPFRVKMEAFFHLTASFCHPLVLSLAILTVPAMPYLMQIATLPWYEALFLNLLLISSTLSALSFYTLSQRQLHGDWMRRLRHVPVLFAVGIGLSVNNARAVLEALFHKDATFVRTPKYGTLEGSSAADWSGKKYTQRMGVQPLIELGLAAYFAVGEVYLIAEGLYPALPTVVMFQCGFLFMGILSLLQQRAPKPARRELGGERTEAGSIT